MQIGLGYCDRIDYETGWDGGESRRDSAYTAPRGTAVDPTGQSGVLKALVGTDVALWITDDPFYAMPTLLQFNKLAAG